MRMKVDLERAKELLRVLDMKTSKSKSAVIRRALYVQEFLADTKKQIEVEI